MAKNSKVGVWEKLAYAGGDGASNLFWMFMVYFINYFYSDVFGLSGLDMATMFAVVRLVFDLATDFIMGVVSDNTNSKMGKFRPYLLYSAIPFGLIYWLMLTTPDMAYGAKLVYAYITFALMLLIYTVINVPYCAMLGVISSNTQERTSVASFRFSAAQVAGIFVQAFTLYLVAVYGGGTVDNPENERFGFSMTGLTYGVVTVVLFLLAFLYTKERVQPPKGQNKNILSDLKNLVANRPWWIMLIVSMFFIAAISFRLGSIMYYFKYYAAETTMKISLFGADRFLPYNTMFMILGTAVTLVVTMFASQIAKACGGKKSMFLIFITLSAVSCFVFYFVPPEATGMMFILHFLFALSTGPLGAIIYAMYADTADYSEYTTGRRSTALIFSAATAAQKGGWSIAGIVTGGILAYYGYNAGDASADAIGGIRMLMSVYPAIAAIIAAVFVFYYPLSDKKMLEIEKVLLERRAASDAEDSIEKI